MNDRCCLDMHAIITVAFIADQALMILERVNSRVDVCDGAAKNDCLGEKNVSNDQQLPLKTF